MRDETRICSVQDHTRLPAAGQMLIANCDLHLFPLVDAYLPQWPMETLCSLICASLPGSYLIETLPVSGASLRKRMSTLEQGVAEESIQI